MRSCPDDDGVRCRQVLHFGGEVRGLPNNIYRFRCIFCRHVPHNDESRLNAEARADFYTVGCVKIRIERL